MKVGIVGATGAVGEEVIKVLFDRREKLGGVESVKLFASERSAGKVVETPFGNLTIEEFALEKMNGLDYVFLAVSGTFAKDFGKKIGEQGPVVIDNSSAFRYDADIPLVIPEINGHAAKNAKLIANPNCTTAIAAMALFPIHQRFGIKRLIISTYQAASGAGAEGMQELEHQAKAFCHNKAMEVKTFQHPLMFNLIPHIDSFQENMYTREEMKVVWETRKIFGVNDIDISCTCVRIPTLRAHAEAITVETHLPVTTAEVQKVISEAEGVELVDEPKEFKYPMPLNASSKYDVEAGRIRQSLVFGKYGVDLFVCGDQLLRGAALNAVLIAEFMEKGEYPTPKPFKASPITSALTKKIDGRQALVIAGAAALLGAVVASAFAKN